MAPQSRRPHTSRSKIATDIEDLITAIRPQWRARKIRTELIHCGYTRTPSGVPRCTRRCAGLPCG
jgi:hypothetical protein